MFLSINRVELKFFKFFKDGRADCIANEDGERQIPTMVAFSGEEEVSYLKLNQVIVNCNLS